MISNALPMEILQFCTKPSTYVEYPFATIVFLETLFKWQCVNPLWPSDARDLGQRYSGNGLLPDGIETLPMQMFTYNQQCPLGLIQLLKLNLGASNGLVLNSRAGASTTRILVLLKMINMNILKTLYSSATRVLIFQYSYSHDEYSPQPCWTGDKPLPQY